MVSSSGGGSRITILVVAAEETTTFTTSRCCKPGKPKPAGLATLKRNSIPSTPKASFSPQPQFSTLIPLLSLSLKKVIYWWLWTESCGGEQGLGCISKYEPTDSLYIKLEESIIPPGWYNDPITLNLDCCFNGKFAEENLTEEFKTEYNMSKPLPIIVYGEHGLWLIDGGNGKFYLWQDVEDFVGEVYECNLAIILSTLAKNRGLKGTKWRKLGHLGCRPPSPDWDDPWM